MPPQSLIISKQQNGEAVRVVYTTANKPIITAHCSLCVIDGVHGPINRIKGQDVIIAIYFLFTLIDINIHCVLLQMAKQFNDLRLKNS